MHRTGKCLQHSTVIGQLAKWLSVRLPNKRCEFESRFSNLNFKYRAHFEQGVSRH